MLMNSKSHILGLGIDDFIRSKLKKQYPYTWSSTGIKYLGKTLTATVDQLIDANYMPFLSKRDPKLCDITKTELTWSGRLAAFKMIVLLQFIYLFRALPIPVHQFLSQKPNI